MKVEYYKEFSHELNRDMEFKVFGHAGKPCLVFPPQDGRFYDYENFGMIDAAREYIDAGKIQMFCCDSIDAETFSKQDGDPKERSALQERWFQYIVNELVPRIYKISQYEHKETKGIIATGCSMGGYHATNAFLRRPDIFDCLLSHSGIFEASYFFQDYQDELLYHNSPLNYFADMPKDHPNMELYRKAEIIFCCGRGAWEQDMVDSLHKMEAVLADKEIDAWIDFWGYDVAHDWYWWKKQLVYFLQFIL